MFCCGCSPKVFVQWNQFDIDKKTKSPEWDLPKKYTYSLKHIVAFQGNGDAYPLEMKESGEPGILQYEGIEEQVRSIIKNLQEERRTNPNRKRILLYVHGGLKGIQSSVSEGIHLAELMERIGERQEAEPGAKPETKKDAAVDDYYPILVNWESGMDAAYADHLFRIRQGKEAPVLGPLSAPFYFLADLGRAIFRYPVTMGFQLYRGLTPVPVPSQAEVDAFNADFYAPENLQQIHLGANKISRFSWPWFKDRATLFFPGIIRFVTTPLLDMFGKAGWDNMIRRTQTVFRKPTEFVPKERTFTGEVGEITQQMAGYDSPTLDPILKPEESVPTGGLSILMEELRNLKKQKGQDDYKITLIGHSMGTIILNELLSLYSTEQDFQYDEIVYLAAACTIKDFERSVLPYLEQHSTTKFYNLTLHPYGDAREKTFQDVLPRGSLLEWIDDFASNPATFMQLTLGKWNNAIMAWHIIPSEVRNQVTLKGFGIEDPLVNNRPSLEESEKILQNKPQKHGDFNDRDQLFWRPDYWKIPQL